MKALEAYRRFRHDIEALLDFRCYTIDHLDSEIASGNATVFGDDDAVIVVELRQYPAGAQEVHGLVAAGTLAGVLRQVERAEAWGREQGCAFASIASREGWARTMAPHGYQPHQIVIRKELG